MKMFFRYLDGLGNLPESAPFVVELDGEYLLLNHVNVKIFGKNEIIQQYKIKASDILAFDIVNTAEAKKKSVVGRGIAGAMLFGAVGAVVGGMSGSNQQKVKNVLAISFLPSNSDEPRNIMLDADAPSWGAKNKLEATKLKNALVKIKQSDRVMAYLGQEVGEDGSITL